MLVPVITGHRVPVLSLLISAVVIAEEQTVRERLYSWTNLGTYVGTIAV